MLIALTGYAGAGKDTVGKVLVERHGFRRVSFADRLKLMALDLDPILELVDEETHAHARLTEVCRVYGGLEQAKQLPAVRGLLQTLGVAARDRIHPDVWVNAALDGIGDEDVVITDCRFRNEARAVVARGGRVVYVARPGVGPVNGHVSEHDLAGWPFDAGLDNSGTVEDLPARVAWLLRFLTEVPGDQVLDNRESV